MEYRHITPAVFISRPNRFIAKVLLNGETETVHVKNTGRCRELLEPGNTVYLEESTNPARKTRYDLVTVRRSDGVMVNMDSQMCNDLAEEWLRKGHLFGTDAEIRREVTHGSSRFDFAIYEGNRTTFLEVKGCTLGRDGTGLFPDAPTERGVKHLTELTELADAGYGAAVLFIIQMKGVTELRPNDAADPAFGEALRKAVRAGVKVLAVDCIVTEATVTPDTMIPVNM